jgi:UV DNA damage endonuclease
MYGDKDATLARFKENYVKLSDRVKKRLVLENDDMCWSVEDLLPTCQELGIPMVLDWHHNNVIPGSMREGSSLPITILIPGTQDILKYVPAITALWRAKNITPKQHYSEPRTPTATIRKDLRPHSKRVYNLPPCDPTMDLMIEAKDKEQAVFALRRKYNIEGGLPRQWILTGEKMDEEREIPSEKGEKVFYEEGEEWRFKPPIRMPVRVVKMLDKLEKAMGKVEGEEVEVAKLEEERRKLLAEWEREKRIKWGLETEVEVNGENGVKRVEPVSTPKATPKRTANGKSRKVEIDDEVEDAEYSPVSESKARKTASRRRRKNVDGEVVETHVTEAKEVLMNESGPAGTRMTRSRKTSMGV